MTLLRPAPVPIRQFTYDPVTKTFSAEISDTQGLGRVYDDAVDEGLTVVGTTDTEIVFVVQDRHDDAEGDTQWWDLASTCGTYRMVLFND